MPTPARGTKKYGTRGACTSEFFGHLNLPRETAAAIAEFGNLGVAQSTWKSYRTAQTMLLKCSKDTNQDMELPLNSRKVLIFIDYLARTLGVKGGHRQLISVRLKTNAHCTQLRPAGNMNRFSKISPQRNIEP
jgi:hypothetical protein